MRINKFSDISSIEVKKLETIIRNSLKRYSAVVGGKLIRNLYIGAVHNDYTTIDNDYEANCVDYAIDVDYYYGTLNLSIQSMISNEYAWDKTGEIEFDGRQYFNNLFFSNVEVLECSAGSSVRDSINKTMVDNNNGQIIFKFNDIDDGAIGRLIGGYGLLFGIDQNIERYDIFKLLDI
jgi:hypothetical protein